MTQAHRDQDGLVIGKVHPDTPSSDLHAGLLLLLLYVSVNYHNFAYSIFRPNGQKCVAMNDSGSTIVPGDIVTFSYRFLSGEFFILFICFSTDCTTEAGRSTNCHIQRKREDVEWRDLLHTEVNNLGAPLQKLARVPFPGTTNYCISFLVNTLFQCTRQYANHLDFGHPLTMKYQVIYACFLIKLLRTTIWMVLYLKIGLPSPKETFYTKT